MDNMMLDWATFKQFVTSRTLSIQNILVGDKYYLVAIDSFYKMNCVLDNDGNADVTDFITNFKSKGNKTLATKALPFADKTLPNGKKLFTRIHGISASISESTTTHIDFIVPYPSCKITGINVMGGVLGDKVNLKILDTPTGSNTGVPYYQLNQFGFNMNIVPVDHVYVSDYDADLTQNLVIRIEYIAKDEFLPRLVCINFILHEVKD